MMMVMIMIMIITMMIKISMINRCIYYLLMCIYPLILLKVVMMMITMMIVYHLHIDFKIGGNHCNYPIHNEKFKTLLYIHILGWILHCSSTMDTVPYHDKLWKAYYDSTYTTSSTMPSLNSSSGGFSSSSNYYMMNNNSLMRYLYLFIAFFMGAFITIICISLMNMCNSYASNFD